MGPEGSEGGRTRVVVGIGAGVEQVGSAGGTPGGLEATRPPALSQQGETHGQSVRAGVR